MTWQVLCSDKTGTLTTAQITILPQSIRTFSAYSQEEVCCHPPSSSMHSYCRPLIKTSTSHQPSRARSS